jgi:hypothetical protein
VLDHVAPPQPSNSYSRMAVSSVSFTGGCHLYSHHEKAFGQCAWARATESCQVVTQVLLLLLCAEAGVTVAAPGAGMKWTMMRHGDKVKHLGRPADQRKALIRALVTETLRHGQIRTTKVRVQSKRRLS